MNFKPMFDKVVIKPDDEETMSPGGLHLPPSDERPSKGTIVAVGPGTRAEDGTLTPLSVQVGDRIVFGKYAGSDIKIDGEDFVIIEEESILGILEE
jgi:chaperonin GroES